MRFRRRVRRFAVLAVLTVLVLGVAAVAYTALDPSAGGRLSARYHGRPIVRCPGRVDMGEADLGETVSATFELANDGYGPLEVTNVRAGCACLGPERRTANGYEPVRALTLAPGERAELVLRFRAAAPPGQPMRVGVRFDTNDPGQPDVGILVVVARVHGGLVTDPPHVVLGSVPVGQVVTRRVEVWDSNDPPRSVRRVGVQGLPQLECRFVPADRPADRSAAGILIGHLELILRADHPGDFAATVEVEADGDRPRVARVPVNGQAVRLIRLAPSALTLPLRSDTGPLWSAQCLYRPTGTGPAKVTVASAPEPLDVRVDPGADGAPGFVRVAVREPFRTPGEARTYAVQVRVEADGQSSVIDIPVTVAP